LSGAGQHAAGQIDTVNMPRRPDCIAQERTIAARTASNFEHSITDLKIDRVNGPPAKSDRNEEDPVKKTYETG